MAEDMSLEKLEEIGKRLGYADSNLARFIKEQQDKARDDRAIAREERAKEREHEIRVLELKSQSEQRNSEPSDSVTQLKLNSVQLPYYKDNDDISAYLIRFERLAQLMNIKPELYAVHLGSLLQGKALQIYSSYSQEITSDYDRLKDALLRSIKQTPDNYRKRFRTARISNDETYAQFASHIGILPDYWLDSCKVNKDFANLREFVLCDQFLSSCTAELRIFVKDRNCKTITEMAEVADLYATARNTYPKNVANREMHQNKSPIIDDKSSQKVRVPLSQIKCHSCGIIGHKKSTCPQNPILNRPNTRSNAVNVTLNTPNLQGIPISGTVNGVFVTSIIRDTGCSLIIVSSDLLPDVADTHDKFTDISDYLGRKDKFPLVKCYIDCDYFTGWTTVARAPIKHSSVLIGNVEVLKPIENSAEFNIQHNNVVQAVQTRAGKTKVTHPLFVPELNALNVDCDQFKKLQNSCSTLNAIRDKINKEPYSTKGGAKFKFVDKCGLIYRKCVSSTKPLVINKETLVVPLQCRRLILKLAHDSTLSGHFSHRKTMAKLLDKFYWPGATGDIVNYCKSCDICQRTSHKGRVSKVPLQKLPIVSVPFQRVAVDIIGPISPPSEQGYKYVLTIIDYGTRFPEAIPLKKY